MTETDLHNVERLIASGWDDCINIPELVAEIKRLKTEVARLKAENVHLQRRING